MPGERAERQRLRSWERWKQLNLVSLGVTVVLVVLALLHYRVGGVWAGRPMTVVFWCVLAGGAVLSLWARALFASDRADRGKSATWAFLRMYGILDSEAASRGWRALRRRLRRDH